MSTLLDFAILAPVPLVHIDAGIELSRAGYVAFGTKKWELFRKIDKLRNGLRVPVLIYPSHDYESPAKSSFEVTWYGYYIGSVDSDNGAHPEGMERRPRSTEPNPFDNSGHWATFWHVQDITPLEHHIPISKLHAHASGSWRKNSPPHGPELVHIPETLLELFSK